MFVERISTTEQLRQVAESWNSLAAGVPFRSWEWLTSWWKHYGTTASRELYTLVVHTNDAVVGIVPWYAERTFSQGRILRFLGDGEVCSDYPGLLVEPDHADAVAMAVAQWLTDAADGIREPSLARASWASSPDASGATAADRWNLLLLEAVPEADSGVARLVHELAKHGNTVHRRPGPNCWKITLPQSWDEYLATMSKSHRKQTRRVERRAWESGLATLHTATNSEELDLGLNVLVDLHARRRQSLGESGCFASPRFAGFLREVAERLFASGRLQLCWVEWNHRPIAAEFQLLGDAVTYAYQAGIDPEAMSDEPGRMIQIATIRAAIERGDREFDFLRGDEPYKAHWRAEPGATSEIRVVPRQAVAQLGHRVWIVGQALKGWMKHGWGQPVATRSPGAETDSDQ